MVRGFQGLVSMLSIPTGSVACAALGWELGLLSMAGEGCSFLPDTAEGAALRLHCLMCPWPVRAVLSATALPAELDGRSRSWSRCPFPWKARGAGGVTAIPIAPAWEGVGARAGLPAHGGALICMLVKLTSNDNPNYVCLVYDEGYISD